MEEVKDKKILCVGIPPSYLRQLFFRELHESGCDITMLLFPGDEILIKPSFKTIFSESAGSEEVAEDTAEEVAEEAGLEKILPELSRETFDCAITYNELRVDELSRLATKLNLRHQPLSPETARACRDKAIMKEIFSKAQVPTAAFGLWSELKGLEESLEKLNLAGKEYVLKPRRGTSSEGVYHAHAGEPAGEAFKKFMILCEEGARSQAYSRILSPPFLVEKYLSRRGESVEVAVEGQVHNSEPKINLISEKVDMIRSRVFLENKYLSPPQSSFIIEDIPKMEAMAEKAVRALGINNSLFHLELRYDDDGPKVLEIAARPGGGLITASSRIRMGFDPLLQHLLLHLGMPPREAAEQGKATCFGTVYYQEGFNPKRLKDAVVYLEEINAFYEINTNLETRKEALHDWLIAFGVTAASPQEAYLKYYENSNNIAGRLSQTTITDNYRKHIIQKPTEKRM